jgi:uncharacterized protein YceK
MAIRAVCVGFLFFSLLGCGTVNNTVLTRPEDGGKIPFGGVREDMEGIKTSEQNSKAARPLLCAIDLPFSAIGDVVTLPYTWAYTVINEPVPPVPPTSAPPMSPPGSQMSPSTSPMTYPGSKMAPALLPTLPSPVPSPPSPPLPN